MPSSFFRDRARHQNCAEARGGCRTGVCFPLEVWDPYSFAHDMPSAVRDQCIKKVDFAILGLGTKTEVANKTLQGLTGPEGTASMNYPKKQSTPI